MMSFNYYSRFLLLSIWFLSAVGYVQAQEKKPVGDKRTLGDLVNVALKNSQLLGSQDARIQQTRLSASQARAWPGLSLGLSTGRKKVDSAKGPTRGLAFSQPLPLLGKLGLQGDLLDLESESWKIRREAMQTQITLDVVQLAYDYTTNQQKAAFVGKRQKRFELIHNYLSGRVFPTPQRKAESRIVRNHLKNLSSDAIQSTAHFDGSYESLKIYIPLGPGEYPDIDTPWFLGEKGLDQNAALAQLLKNNPDLRAQKLAVKSAELEKGLASKTKLPDPSIGASYDEARAGETEKEFGLGLNLALPSWNLYQAGTRSAEQKMVAEEKQLGFEEQKQKAEMLRLLVEIEAARRTVQQYPKSLIVELEAQLGEAEDGFRKGQVDLLTFLELDGSTAETYARVLDAQREFAAVMAQYMALIGEVDPLKQLGSF